MFGLMMLMVITPSSGGVIWGQTTSLVSTHDHFNRMTGEFI
jgi:hypothetical protein